MTTLATPSDYKKEYLPGYTGHVPSKNERFGQTAGNIKREILDDLGKHPVNLEKYSRIHDGNRLFSPKFTPAIDKNKQIHGNYSRFSKNWVCGPNHEIRHQQVPGYTGHIKGLVSENLYATSYGNVTAKAIGKKHPIGYDLPNPKQRFISQNTSQYHAKNFRRFIERPEMRPRKDYDDYTTFVNDTYSDSKAKMFGMLSMDDREESQSPKNLFSGGKHLSIMRNIIKTRNTNTASQTTRNSGMKKINFEPERDEADQFATYEVQPRILESRVSTSKDFCRLSDGFKRCFSSERSDRNIIIPIAGYGGHRRGDRSQNFFGKGFRETSLQSKKLERKLKNLSLS